LNWNAETPLKPNNDEKLLRANSWASAFVEIMHGNVDGNVLLMFGATRATDGQRAVGTFKITDLFGVEGQPGQSRFTGDWLNYDFTFHQANSPWTTCDLHHGAMAYFNSMWVYIYDGRLVCGDTAPYNWNIGLAHSVN
jgi:hypothetical protein